MKKKDVTRTLTFLFLAIWIVTPLITSDSYIIHMFFMATIFSVLACSLNIVVGITGLSNMAHATFFGIGAYVTALLAVNFNMPFYLNLILGAVISMIFGLILGVPTLRLKGFYLALVTIAFGQVIRIVEINWDSVTRGPMGIPGIPGANIGSYIFEPKAYIYYSIIILVIMLIMTRRMLDSKMGRALSAIKNDDIVAKSLGVNTTRYKVIAFTLSAFFAGMAGSIYAHYIAFVSPDSFTQADSTTILCMVILGGSGTLFGPIFGAIILILVPEILRFADMYRLIFVGVLMILSILAKEGHWGQHLQDYLKRFYFNVIKKKALNKELR